MLCDIFSSDYSHECPKSVIIYTFANSLIFCDL
uniref:Uncharacterized protein n=1 Tax=Triticum urartu TaxID=4572 RepID=A0A8R7R2W1_TRIUA